MRLLKWFLILFIFGGLLVFISLPNFIAAQDRAKITSYRNYRNDLQEPNFTISSQKNNTESYNYIDENIFLDTIRNPLSTFSIDVDTASYSIVRRFINNGQLPPKDAVRIEELINYFTYDYPQPNTKEPFSINLEVSDCPWNKGNKLIHIGLQGKNADFKDTPPGNLVFLIDTSGSMNEPNKLPLLQSAFKLLVKQLKPVDNISIVTYAGSAGLVLGSTSGAEKEKIIKAIDNLEAGGSTAGGEGIELAYKIANENFLQNGNNRVILATDGDFNVGVSSDGELIRLIEKKRMKNIFLSVLGFGSGNYKDSKMEQLADKGNGNYSYIDNIREAQKVFIKQITGNLVTIAKDVKLQIEFNPSKVKEYRLIGYENRVLRNEDFNNDKKDAGELGAGHTVTALYEIVPANQNIESSKIDSLKYQETKIKDESLKNNEIVTIKFRYKEPKSSISKIIVKTLEDRNTDFNNTSNNFKFSVAVAGFGLLLRESELKGNLKYDDVIELANNSKGEDNEGYREEFINMVKISKDLSMKID